MHGSFIRDDAEFVLVESFFGAEEALRIYRRLLNELAWQEETLPLYGRSVKVPRLVCWYGDPAAVYAYSGVVHQPLPWSPTLSRLRDRVAEYTQREFNSVLANLYRDGNDSMGWHADNEKELGAEPLIASLSFGATRTFKIRHNKSKATHSIELASGSLLTMGGLTQKHWRHCIPKTSTATKARINLTFRTILVGG